MTSSRGTESSLSMCTDSLHVSCVECLSSVCYPRCSPPSSVERGTSPCPLRSVVSSTEKMYTGLADPNDVVLVKPK